MIQNCYSDGNLLWHDTNYQSVSLLVTGILLETVSQREHSNSVRISPNGCRKKRKNEKRCCYHEILLTLRLQNVANRECPATYRQYSLAHLNHQNNPLHHCNDDQMGCSVRNQDNGTRCFDRSAFHHLQPPHHAAIILYAGTTFVKQNSNI